MEPKENGPYVISVDQPSPNAATLPLEGFQPTANPFTMHSISGPSFIRRQKELAAPCYPISALAWYLLRDVCDWYDSDFTQDGEENSPKRSISIRLLLLFVPFLAAVDCILNLFVCLLILPMLFLKCCYPFKPKLIEARKNSSPRSCCCLHEACDPLLRVLTSLSLVIHTPLVLAGICFPEHAFDRFVYWADGHTSGFVYLDRNCFCCSTQFPPFGIFFRNRSVGDVMA